MALPKETVLWVAELAQIKLTAQEETDMAEKLSAILGYVDELQGVDVVGVTETGGQITGLTDAMEADEVKNCEIPREEFLKRAPMREGAFIKVKKVFN